MQNLDILIIGAGIGGLTAGITLGRHGHRVKMIESDPDWAVYGVGIIQQANVIRAMNELGLLHDYLDAGFGFDSVDIFSPAGQHLASVPSAKLVENAPAIVGISRRSLQNVLSTRAKEAGADIRLGVTAEHIDNRGDKVKVSFSDSSVAEYDLVVGADGLTSRTRDQVFPEAARPQFTGQGVWRYNFPRPEGHDSMHVYAGPVGMGLVPISQTLMYLYLVTPEPGNPRHAHDSLAAIMRDKLKNAPPAIAALAEQITDNDAVVYRPLEWQFIEEKWFRNHVLLLGDAVHATTPHLGQGAGMAIEDGIVLADELDRGADIASALHAWQQRRFERCRYIVEKSKAIGESQLGLRPPVDQAAATGEMFQVVAQPI